MAPSKQRAEQFSSTVEDRPGNAEPGEQLGPEGQEPAAEEPKVTPLPEERVEAPACTVCGASPTQETKNPGASKVYYCDEHVGQSKETTGPIEQAD